ncbi:hypothetical protein ACE0DR_25700 [Azotobacter sp. CWF10]
MTTGPGAATCEALSGQNCGSTYRAYRPKYGYYRGSDSSIGYGTILSKRRGANGYASLSHDFDNGQQWFADAAGLPHDVADARRHPVGPHGCQR